MMRPKYFDKIDIRHDIFDEELELRFSNPGMHSVITVGPDDLDALADLAPKMRQMAQKQRERITGSAEHA